VLSHEDLQEILGGVRSAFLHPEVFEHEQIDAKLPETVTESFAGVGNPHAIATLPAGSTVVDIGSGADMDLLLAACHVGAHGRAIGVDMTEAMRDRARRGAAACQANRSRRPSGGEARPGTATG
jgi:hypothetical protein